MSCFALKLCNYNQSVALKELGFPQKNVDVKFSYAPCTIVNDYVLSKFDEEENYPVAPSLTLAADWLRKEKNINIMISNYDGRLAGHNEVSYMYLMNYIKPIKSLHTCDTMFDSYDDALSAAIDKAIELIKRNN